MKCKALHCVIGLRQNSYISVPHRFPICILSVSNRTPIRLRLDSNLSPTGNLSVPDRTAFCPQQNCCLFPTGLLSVSDLSFICFRQVSHLSPTGFLSISYRSQTGLLSVINRCPRGLGQVFYWAPTWIPPVSFPIVSDRFPIQSPTSFLLSPTCLLSVSRYPIGFWQVSYRSPTGLLLI